MLNGKTKVYAVIGDPVEHSISPMIHNTLFEYYGMDAVYVPFAISPKELPSCFHAMKEMGIQGYNITIPHKKEIARLADVVDGYAKAVGAVNTISMKEGESCGYNTDGVGLMRALEEAGFAVKGKHVVILGAGGVVNSIAVKFAMEQAGRITILARRPAQAQAVCSLVSLVSPIASADAWNRYPDYLKSCDLLVNATPAGMAPRVNDCPVDSLAGLSSSAFVCDLIYNPYETQLLKKAAALGCSILNGLPMLLYQGFASFEIWTGIRPDQAITQKIKKMTCEVLHIG